MRSLIATAIAHKRNLEHQIAEATNVTGTAVLRLKLRGIRPSRWSYLPAISPCTYVRAILPFIVEWGYNYKSMKIAEVDPHLVVGGHFQNHAEGTEREENEKIELLNSLTETYVASGEINGNLARYAQVGDLPFFVALEGKNRVELYRRRGKAIKAMITKWKYPKAEHLTLYRSLPFGTFYLRCREEHFLSVSKNHYEVLAYPDISLPILRKYGVKQGREIYIKPLAFKDAFDVRCNTCNDLMAG